MSESPAQTPNGERRAPALIASQANVFNRVEEIGERTIQVAVDSSSADDVVVQQEPDALHQIFSQLELFVCEFSLDFIHVSPSEGRRWQRSTARATKGVETTLCESWPSSEKGVVRLAGQSFTASGTSSPLSGGMSRSFRHRPISLSRPALPPPIGRRALPSRFVTSSPSTSSRPPPRAPIRA
jgi:hypothetical protein